MEEILQQGDTAIIYPEAPEDEQSPAETGGADENGKLDDGKNRSRPSASVRILPVTRFLCPRNPP